MATEHIEEERLELYAMGKLSECFIPDVEEHLLTCSFCQGRLSETDDFVVHFREAVTLVAERPAPFWKRFPNARSLLWISSVVAAGVVLLVITDEPRPARFDPAVVLLQSMRGPEARAQMASGRPGLMVFDLPLNAVPANYETEIVDALGKVVLKPSAHIAQSRLTALIDRLAPGGYWVRVYRTQPARELLAEYGLQVQ
jgi:hypothetical protein